MNIKSLTILIVLAGLQATVHAADLTIPMNSWAKEARKSVRYQCDYNARKLGLPDRPFTVDYINRGNNSLAVLTIFGESLIFANVDSGSGARYAARQYIWWEAAGRSVSLSSDSSRGGRVVSSCRPVR